MFILLYHLLVFWVYFVSCKYGYPRCHVILFLLNLHIIGFSILSLCLHVSLHLKWVFCRQQRWVLFFVLLLFSVTLCLMVGGFTVKVFINRYVLIVILFIVFWFFYNSQIFLTCLVLLWFHGFFLGLCLDSFFIFCVFITEFWFVVSIWYIYNILCVYRLY